MTKVRDEFVELAELAEQDKNSTAEMKELKVQEAILATDENKSKDKLSERVRSYLEDHSVTKSVTSNYTLGAVTLKHNPDNLLVFTSKVFPQGAYVGYFQFASADLEVGNKDIKIREQIQRKTFFCVYRRPHISSNLVQVNKRYFEPRYGFNSPQLSESQSYAFFVDFTKVNNVIDVYECKNLDFFEKEQSLLTPGDESFSCSLVISDEVASDYVRVVTNQKDDSTVVVLGKKAIQIFRIQDSQDKESSGLKLKRKPQIEYVLKNKIYDYIMDFNLDDSDYLNSKVTLVSKEFRFVQIMQLSELIEIQQQQDKADLIQNGFQSASNSQLLGSNFIEAGEEVRIQFKADIDQSFWDEIDIVFRKDGLGAILSTPYEKYQIGLNPRNRTKYCKYKTIKQYENKKVCLFQCKQSDFIVCEKNEIKMKMQFLNTSTQSSHYEILKYNYRADTEVLEVTEFKRGDTNIFRVTSMRESCELQVTETDEDNDRHTVAINSSAASGFRWPFYAIGVTDFKINICNLTQPLLNIGYSHNVKENEIGGQIKDIVISNRGNLIYSVMTDKEVIFYKVNLKRDLEEERGKTLKQLLSFNSIIGHRNTPNPSQENQSIDSMDILNNLDNIGGKDKSIQRVIDYGQMLTKFEKSKVVKSFGVHERELFNFTTDTFILSHEKKQVRLLIVRQGRETVNTILPEQVEKYIDLHDSVFAIKLLNQEAVMRVEADYNSEKGYIAKIAYQEFDGTIRQINGDKRKLYSLIEQDGQVSLKVFYSRNKDFDYICQIKNIHQTHPEFVSSFTNFNVMHRDIFVQSESMFTRIYDGMNGGNPSIQDFEDYLPVGSDSSKALLRRSVRVCPRYNRILLLYSYPNQKKPFRISVTPYFTDRHIDLPFANVKQACWVESSSKIGKKIEQNSDEYKVFNQSEQLLKEVKRIKKMQKVSVFQLIPSLWIFTEYNLAGMVIKKTKFASKFKNKMILCVAQRGARYLVTPISQGYLDRLEVQEITNEHEVRVVQTLDTKEISIYLEKMSKESNLYDYMGFLKNTLKCTFEFQLNMNDTIAIAARRSQDQKLVDIVLIRQIISSKFNFEVQAEIRSDADFESIRTNNCQFKAFRAHNNNYVDTGPIEQLGQPCDFIEDIFTDTQNPNLFQQPNKFRLYEITKIFDRRVEMLKNATKFKLSNFDLILWGDQDILYTKLDVIKDDSLIQLKSLKFSLSSKDTLTSTEESNDNKRDRIINILSSGFGMSNENGLKQSLIVIQIKLKTKELLTVVYNMDREREVSWHQGDRYSSLLVDSNNQPYCHENEVGLFSTNDKHTLYHFNVYGDNEQLLHKEDQIYGMEWGHRLYKTGNQSYLIGAAALIMPYNFQSVIQHYQPAYKLKKIQNFYADDYYMVDGGMNLQRFNHNPIQLEKLLDQYFEQKPMSILCILIKQNNTQTHLDMSQTQAKISSDFTMKSAISEDFLDKRSNFSKQDSLQIQLDQSGDRIVNKMLFYLSELPIQFSMFQITHRLPDLLNYSRFTNYFDKAFESTSQMTDIRILKTALPPGQVQLNSNISYLNEDFFNRFQALSDSTKVPFEDQTFKQANIKFIRISWITADSHERKFLQSLVENAHISIFMSENINAIAEFLWTIARPYFIYNEFIPFVVFTFIPVILLPLTIFFFDEEKANLPANILHGLLLIFITIGSIKNIVFEIMEIGKNDVLSYLLNIQNYYQIGLIISTFCVTVFSFLASFAKISESQDDKTQVSRREQFEDYLTVSVTISLMLLLIELPNQLRVFDFFSTFVRALIITIAESTKILSLFLIIVGMQTVLIFVIDQGKFYVGFQGLLDALAASYFMSVGDFTVVENFEGHKFYWLFMSMFYICSILSLFIILNMVIAVMSAIFEKIQEENEAHITLSKIQKILDYWFRIPQSYRNKFKENKYLILVDIDPKLDGITDEDSEIRIRNDMKGLKKLIFNLSYEQTKTNFNILKLQKGLAKVGNYLQKNQ